MSFPFEAEVLSCPICAQAAAAGLVAALVLAVPVLAQEPSQDEINRAAAEGDRSENADYQYNKKLLREIDQEMILGDAR